MTFGVKIVFYKYIHFRSEVPSILQQNKLMKQRSATAVIFVLSLFCFWKGSDAMMRCDDNADTSNQFVSTGVGFYIDS